MSRWYISRKGCGQLWLNYMSNFLTDSVPSLGHVAIVKGKHSRITQGEGRAVLERGILVLGRKETIAHCNSATVVS